MDGISRSREWDKEIPHGVLPMEQLVLNEKWVRKIHPEDHCLASQGLLPLDRFFYLTLTQVMDPFS